MYRKTFPQNEIQQSTYPARGETMILMIRRNTSQDGVVMENLTGEEDMDHHHLEMETGRLLHKPISAQHQQRTKEVLNSSKKAQNVFEPRPIDFRRMEVIDYSFPMRESNLLLEGNDFVESIVSIFGSKKRSLGDILHEASSVAERGGKRACESAATIERPDTKLSSDFYEQQHRSSPLARCSSNEDSTTSSRISSSTSGRKNFRSYQQTLWQERFEELCSYTKTHGSTLVPDNWAENKVLAKWCRRQRHQYTLKQQGKHSTLTDDRQTALDGLGFIWDSHNAVWEEHLEELREFKRQHGHCNVPSTYTENKSLSIWVQWQRRQFKHFNNASNDCAATGTTAGKKGQGMTVERIAKLDELGFIWNPRKGGSSSTK